MAKTGDGPDSTLAIETNLEGQDGRRQARVWNPSYGFSSFKTLPGVSACNVVAMCVAE